MPSITALANANLCTDVLMIEWLLVSSTPEYDVARAGRVQESCRCSTPDGFNVLSVAWPCARGAAEARRIASTGHGSPSRRVTAPRYFTASRITDVYTSR